MNLTREIESRQAQIASLQEELDALLKVQAILSIDTPKAEALAKRRGRPPATPQAAKPSTEIFPYVCGHCQKGFKYAAAFARHQAACENPVDDE